MAGPLGFEYGEQIKIINAMIHEHNIHKNTGRKDTDIIEELYDIIVFMTNVLDTITRFNETHIQKNTQNAILYSNFGSM